MRPMTRLQVPERFPQQPKVNGEAQGDSVNKEDSSIRKIYVDQLVPGMYVISRRLGSFSPYIYEREGVVRSKQEIRDIKDHGYLECYIDFAKSDGLGVTGGDTLNVIYKVMDDEETSKYEEDLIKSSLKKNLDIHNRAIQAYMQLQSAVERDRGIDCASLTATIDELCRGVLSCPETMMVAARASRADYSLTHAVNVAITACAVEVANGAGAERLFSVAMAGFLHDIGKQKISSKLLNTSRRLSRYELDELHKHSEYSYQLITGYPEIPKDARLAVLEHHERFDGTGYPQKKSGGDTSEIGYVIGLADTFDAMVSERPHQHRTIPSGVMSSLFKLRDKAFPAIMIERFIAALGVYPLGTMVRLSTGYTGIVLGLNLENPLAPKVGLIKNNAGRIVPLSYINLATEQMATIAESIHFSLHSEELAKLLTLLAPPLPKKKRGGSAG